jgi:hypothetical protein
MKIHLFRSTRSTWCGRQVADVEYVSRDVGKVDCKTCIKANEAEETKETGIVQGINSTLKTIPSR